MICSFSNLTDQEIKAIQELESSLKTSLLAFSCQNLKISDLSQEDLSRIQELEKRMGISLVAVDAG